MRLGKGYAKLVEMQKFKQFGLFFYLWTNKKHNMKSLKIFAVIVALLAFVSSCSKSPNDILTTTTWMQDSSIVGGIDQLKDCDRDNSVVFTTTGKIISTPMGVACSLNEKIDTTMYALSADAKQLNVFTDNDTLNFQVTELTSSRLILSAGSAGAGIVAKFRAK